MFCELLVSTLVCIVIVQAVLQFATAFSSFTTKKYQHFQGHKNTSIVVIHFGVKHKCIHIAYDAVRDMSIENCFKSGVYYSNRAEKYFNTFKS